ncbi:general transcription factor 3C polypeptide 6 isoform X4 [Elephas maximus indicus]|uniref:general transcription factor 3C polypeptide 6 isoform X4 n=1 Tax=Elephas maximus indicus TaxID=99487 RepID=UPI00054051A3|nr:general transcription factor 3C polypeptide 6 isoform X2 [Loxodonta africana]XP_049754988.1 general transcription factor 3C polypeptide 6 isoform X4 [Elephas maximus indicus]
MAAAEDRRCEEWEEEEEQLVLVELSGIIDSDFLSKCENKCKILGIDTERPIMQVDNYVFAGEYEDTLGTCVIFEEDVEEHGGVEWLQIKDNDSSNRPNMICSFLHENEDEEVVAQAPDKPLELKEQEIQMKDNSDLSYEQGKPLHLEIEDSGPLIEIPSFDTEGFDFMETQDADLEATPR